MNPYQLLSQQFQAKTLPHAILINGAVGAGKLDLATWLTSVISCLQPQVDDQNIVTACQQCKSCLLKTSNNYPDHLTLLPHSASLGIDDIRHGNTFLEKTAFLGKYKTVLIPNAQAMTIAAANALLKTLEEPTDDSIIILLCHDVEMLLPTIVSRCRLYNLKPLVGEALLESVNAHHISTEARTQLDTNFINISQLPELSDATVYQRYLQFKESFSQFIVSGHGESTLLQQLVNDEHGLRWLEKITANMLREHSLSRKNPLLVSPAVLIALYQVIIESSRVIKSNIQANQQFVLEQLVVKMSSLVTQQA